MLKRISELEAQNLALIAENERLRKELGLPLENIVTQQPTIESVYLDEKETTIPFLNKYSPPDEKIELFMSLFRGRTDTRIYLASLGQSVVDSANAKIITLE